MFLTPSAGGSARQYARKRCRRELLDDLPALFTDLPSSGTVRVNFWRTATELFRDGYIRQISSWCKAHNWLLTGHHLAEERPLDQIPANGSLMAHYSGYDIPGTDHLCRIKPDQVVMIQLVSAAMQSGKERILTESFGLSGWNLNFQGMYWIYHQQLACGIDLLCQHLSSYSLRGLRKRDYPGSYFVHQPWWEEYKTVNDHFAFAGVMIGRGKAETKLAVIHPLSTGWCNFTGDVRGPAADFYNGALIGLTGKLTAAFREFHFIDEMIFDESGGTAHGLLTVGKCAYDTVLIPPLTDLSAKIAGSLFDFAAAGGRIMMMNNRFEPGKLTLDGVPADEKTRSFFASLPHFDSAEEIVSALDAILPPVMRLLENGVPSSAFTGICRRIDGSVFGRSGKFYLIANGDYRQAHTLELFLPLSGAGVEIISPDGRQFSPVAGAETAGNFRHFPCHFAEGEGIMFFVPDETVSTAGPVSTADPYDRRVIRDLAGDFRLEGDPRNLLLLDRCRYRIDGGAWIDDDVSVIHGRLLRGRRDARLEMEFSFDIDDDFDLSEAIEVIAEDPARYTFSLNGKNFPAADTGMLFDSAFRRIKLPRALKRGRNTLTLSTVFHETPETWDILERAKRFETEYNRLTFESEIENIFLYGKFTIRHRGSVEVLDRSAFRLNGSFSLAPLHPGMTVDERNTVLDGFPFFAGRLTLRKTFRLNADEAGKIMFLRFKPLGANSFRIRINGVEAGFLYAGKFCIDVSGMLKEGENTVTVEMVSSLRNMLGPHHLAEGESYRVTTLSFSREANAVGWKPPEFADGYCVVGFGFSDMALTR